MDSGRIRARIDRQYLVLHVDRDVDGEVGALRDRLQALDPNTDVVLDMSAVELCSPAGFTALWSTSARFAAAGGSLTISRPTPTVRATLRDAGLAHDVKVRRRDR